MRDEQREERVEVNRLVMCEQFEAGKYYWVRYNCDFLIGKVHVDGNVEDILNKENWYISGDNFKHKLPMALTVFTGGMYGPLKPPYGT